MRYFAGTALKVPRYPIPSAEVALRRACDLYSRLGRPWILKVLFCSGSKNHNEVRITIGEGKVSNFF